MAERTRIKIAREILKLRGWVPPGEKQVRAAVETWKQKVAEHKAWLAEARQRPATPEDRDTNCRWMNKVGLAKQDVKAAKARAVELDKGVRAEWVRGIADDLANKRIPEHELFSALCSLDRCEREN